MKADKIYVDDIAGIKSNQGDLESLLDIQSIMMK